MCSDEGHRTHPGGYSAWDARLEWEGCAIAWIVPAVLGITSLIAGNAQNKAATKNNDNQQASAEANAQQRLAAAQSSIAPWTKPEAAPFANRQIQGPPAQNASPGAGAYGIGGGGQLNAASVMQGPPGQPPAPQSQMPGPGGSGAGGPNPQMLAMFMQFLSHAMGQGGTGRQTMPIQRAPAPPPVPPGPGMVQPQPFNMRQAQ